MRTIVYGNGKSRQKWNLNEKLDNVVTWGCNRIFNDAKVDNLVAMDCHIQHMVYASGYAKENRCWFADWIVNPQDLRENLKYMHMYPIVNNTIEIKVSGEFIENEKGTRTKFVVKGKDEGPHQGMYCTWVDDYDRVEYIEYPRGWCSGTTAIHLACQQGATEIYLMGFDLSENPINSVYEKEQDGQKMRSDPNVFCHRPDWEQEMKTVINEFRDRQFIWVEPHGDTMKFDVSNLTYDTYENVRKKLCQE